MIALTDASVPISVKPYGCLLAVQHHGGHLRRRPAPGCRAAGRADRAAAPLPLDFVRRERRVAAHVGHQIEQRAEILLQRASR